MKLARLPALLALAACSFAWAGPQEAYTPQLFQQLQSQGKPILVAIHADWCPTCKAQKPILRELMARPDYKDVTELTVDYDKDKTAVQRFKASMQSTLVAFRGDKEVGRSVGDTSRAGLEGLVRKAAH
jgi:thiol-disulfide isomerase/thioredoxin